MLFKVLHVIDSHMHTTNLSAVNNEGIWVHAEPGRLWLRLVGRGNFQNAHFLKDLMNDALHHHESIQSAQIDISRCTGLDSTFLGALAGMAIQIKKNGGTTTITGASGRNRELIENMGLNLIVSLVDNTSDEGNFEHLKKHEGVIADKDSAAATMLEAHETLAGLSQQNQIQFQNVIDYLRKRMARTTASK